MSSPYQRGHSHTATTLLAAGWGIASAYALFTSLTHPKGPQILSALVALLPLAAAWGTIERKRWGRLALLGMSAASLGIVIAAFAQNAGAAWMQGLNSALKLLGGGAGQAAGGYVMALSAASGFWFRRPAVVLEFDWGKKKTLAVAQAAIAVVVVGSWGTSVLLNTPDAPAPVSASKAAKKKSGGPAKRNAKQLQSARRANK